MPKAICRIAKLKSGGAIAASESHTKRTRDTPNADLSKFNERFIGSPVAEGALLENEVFARIGSNGGKKIRTDAVLCVEMMLTASPEYFRPGDRGKAGEWDSEQLETWKDAVGEWLEARYGDRVVRAELHLDEATPHIHIYLVPLDDQDKLNCKSLFGDRKKLSQLQDSYAQAVAHLGLERGIKGSRATHTQVKDYYSAVTKEPDQELSQDEIHHQLADRARVLKENDDLERTARSLEREKELLQQRVRDLEVEAHHQRQAAQNWQQKYRARVAELREIPLADVAIELGFDPDSKDKRKWKDESRTINITGSKFYDFGEMRGGGGAIDLVMQMERCSFTDAIGWLHNRFGRAEVSQTIARQVERTLEEQPPQSFTPPQPDEQHWQQVRNYLIQKRKLPSALIDRLHEDGLLYADKHQNAVFLRMSFEGEVTGASLRGTAGENNSFKGLAAGTRRTQGCFMVGADNPERAVICESPIDALSYAVLYPSKKNTLYLATDGSGSVPLERLKELPEVVLALDNDAAGEAIAQRLQAELPGAQRHVSNVKDWNEDLQLHLQQLQQQLMKSRQRIYELNDDRGIE
ncbi:plasmid recombination protein [Microcoleus sp. FACHB-1515]|uniref:MobV family relaxase n=1 Tax=Cyanophyceae TaxID=3028117 RepID=UPI001689D74B|nr:MobV family relaxase [Microcoleus sp. FACHB-1515]MBD2091831.1 plasmid recombination protein [Microcoleus sp. FACHB-1515]